MAFGEHDFSCSVIGTALSAVAICGMACGWLGDWGCLLWTILLLVGLLYLGPVSHWEILRLSQRLVSVIAERLKNRD